MSSVLYASSRARARRHRLRRGGESPTKKVGVPRAAGLGARDVLAHKLGVAAVLKVASELLRVESQSSGVADEILELELGSSSA